VLFAMIKYVKCFTFLILVAYTNIGMGANCIDPDFTPYGAKSAGNHDGSIGRWVGEHDKVRLVLTEIENEKPLYKIDITNVGNYKELLPLGLEALVRNYPQSFYINVFPSHRASYYPDWVYQAVGQNCGSAKLSLNGNEIENTYPGIPFPVPRTGIEVIWNHLLSYRGTSISASTAELVVYSDRRGSIIESKIDVLFAYYDRERNISKKDQKLLYYKSVAQSPPISQGNILLVHEKVNSALYPRQSWGYFSNSKKAMRLPGVAYDSPQLGADGIRFADEIDMFNGSPDRYDWKLLGKKELIIPYNNGFLYKSLLNGFTKITSLKHINPAYLRFEMHRAWVVEAVLKEGVYHPYARRVFYIDEDSWMIHVAENYDKDGNLWRVSTSFTKMYLEMPGIFKVLDVFNDLKSKSYFVQAAFSRGIDDDSFHKGFAESAFNPNVLRIQGR